MVEVRDGGLRGVGVVTRVLFSFPVFCQEGLLVLLLYIGHMGNLTGVVLYLLCTTKNKFLLR